ncbi:MAG: methionine--tRNA ligase [Myxococcales bacterium]|nr:MAG: methionine--tRNA ligase [Myxococcales bacterium]
MTGSTRRLLVTSALPYANGHIHLGHLVEYLQTDVWVRFQNLRGNRATYICADDTHGTAIMMRARQEGRSEAELVAAMSEAHQRDFAGFQIRFDHYGSTNSDHSRKLCERIWASLRGAGLIKEREVTQLYDAEAKVFLADRFVKGTCPKCGTPDQYGDSCEKCSSTYSAQDLIDPVSTLSGSKPEVRSSPHLFVEIEKLRPFLTEWTQEPGRLQPEIANYLKGHFLAEELRDWDVSRPAPYFGFEIPDAPGHYWYVWFDAPIGYMGSTAEWCEKPGNAERFEDLWQNEAVEIHHFIGKDIVYFHTLFWPAMLKASGFPLPKRVQVHGMLTVNGEKMSKSRGTFVLASTYLKHLDPSYLRYYYMAKLGSRVEDLDLNLEELVAKVNSDLVGKVVNLASRTARFVTELSPSYPDDGGLFASAAAAGDEIADAYESCDFARAMRTIMALADRANELVDQKQPWALKKQPEKLGELRDVCTIILNLYRQIVVYLTPVLPQLAEQSRALLGAPLQSWEEAKTPLLSVKLGEFSHLMQRVDPKKLEAMIEESKPEAPPAAPVTEGAATPALADDGAALAAEPLAAECSIDDFTKVDLRVARVINAEHIPEANKLLKLTVSLGGDTTRTIFAGIKAAYAPEQLIGRLVVVVANLAPRKMKFGVSEGMVVAAGAGGKEVYVLSPDSGAKPGHRVH